MLLHRSIDELSDAYFFCAMIITESRPGQEFGEMAKQLSVAHPWHTSSIAYFAVELDENETGNQEWSILFWLGLSHTRDRAAWESDFNAFWDFFESHPLAASNCPLFSVRTRTRNEATMKIRDQLSLDIAFNLASNFRPTARHTVDEYRELLLDTSDLKRNTAHAEPDKTMINTWRHPELGVFTWNGTMWSMSTTASEFEKAIRLCIQTKHHLRSAPASNESTLIHTAWTKRTQFVDAAIDRLWSEVQGKTETQNWWGSQPEWERIDETRPASRDELANQLQLVDIVARFFPSEPRDFNGALNPFTKQPMAYPPGRTPLPRPEFWGVELTFRPPFEEEHGIGVVFHNEKLIYTGYGYGQSQTPLDYTFPENE